MICLPKLQQDFFQIQIIILKCMWKGKETRISFQNSLKKKNKMGGISLQDIKNYSTTLVTKICGLVEEETQTSMESTREGKNSAKQI